MLEHKLIERLHTRCRCVIHWGDKLRLGPLELQGGDSENNTKNKEHFQTQIQSKRYNQQYGDSNTIKAMQSNNTAKAI